ncbi:MAG: hydrolase, partial [Actinomycetes bacterium]
LDFVVADIARTIADLRGSGRSVLVHCVAAEQRTPSAAIAYARRLGVPADEAERTVRLVVGNARGRGLLWRAAGRVAPPG